MNITLVNGTGTEARWDEHKKSLEGFKDALNRKHNVDHFPIAEMKMAHCTGCWDCWTKTPGICRLKDEGVEYLKSMINADLVLFATPVVAGFISSHTKKALDRFIPEALPFIGLHKGECHHRKRYKHKKNVGFLLLDQEEIDIRAREIIFRNIDRNSLNMQPANMLKLNLTKNNTKEVCREIDSL